VVGKILGRGPVRSMLSRLFFGILGGGILGAIGAGESGMAATASWSLLMVLPILIGWPWKP